MNFSEYLEESKIKMVKTMEPKTFTVERDGKMLGFVGDVGDGWDYKIYTKGSIQFADKSEGQWAAESFKTKAQAKNALIKASKK